ncbi:MAG: hypothetical protein WCA20_17320 [Candidatus Sulfotelmatobacter sp.]
MASAGRSGASPSAFAKASEDRSRSSAVDASGVKPAAVFRFLSEDWAPWIAHVHMRERWPELRFRFQHSPASSESSLYCDIHNVL